MGKAVKMDAKERQFNESQKNANNGRQSQRNEINHGKKSVKQGTGGKGRGNREH